MSISRQVKWNSTISIFNIMASNCRSEFHFCLETEVELTSLTSVLETKVKIFLTAPLPSPHPPIPPFLIIPTPPYY